MSLSPPSTPQSCPVTMFSENSGDLRERLLSEPANWLRNEWWYVISSLATHARYIVPLPDARPIGESRSQAVRRFLSLEHSLNKKGCFQESDAIMQEYFDLEPVPELTFYLPMHTVYKNI